MRLFNSPSAARATVGPAGCCNCSRPGLPISITSRSLRGAAGCPPGAAQKTRATHSKSGTFKSCIPPATTDSQLESSRSSILPLGRRGEGCGTWVFSGDGRSSVAHSCKQRCRRRYRRLCGCYGAKAQMLLGAEATTLTAVDIT